MNIRAVFIGATILVFGGSTAIAQGRPPKQVVLSEAVLKAMTVNRTKSKTPLSARVGMVRRSGVVTAKPGLAAPTSVREIAPIVKKK